MRVGVPKEIKNNEFRVGLTPASVAELSAAGHDVVVETKAGIGIDFSDQDYVDAGARIAPDAKSVFAGSDMIVKVKEPQAQEIALLESRHLLFTYLHLAADKPQAEGLMKSGATCIAYETVTSRSSRPGRWRYRPAPSRASSSSACRGLRAWAPPRPAPAPRR